MSATPDEWGRNRRLRHTEQEKEKIQMPGDDDTLRIVSQFDVGGIQAGMSEAATAVEQGTARMNESFGQMATVSEYSATEARHALHGLGEEIGIHVPRFVQSFVAQLGGVGPVLAASFAPIAVIGLVEVLGQIPEALDKGINKLNGWNEAAAKAFKDATAGAIKFEKENITINEEIAKIGLIGKTGVEKFDAELAIAAGTTQKLKDLQKEYNDRLEHANAEMKYLEEQTGSAGLAGKALEGSFSFIGGLATKFAGAGKTIAQDKIIVEDLTAAMEELRVEIRRREEVDAARIEADRLEAAKKAAEAYAKEIQETVKALVHLEDLQDKLAAGAAKLADESKLFGDTAGSKGSEDQLKAIRELGDAEEKFRTETEGRAMEAADFAIDQKIREVQAEKSLGEISVRDATTQINSLVAQRLAADEKMLDQEMAVIQSRLEQERATDSKAYAQDLAAYSAMLKKKQQLEQQADLQMEKTDDQANQKMLQSFKKAYQQITTDLNRSVISWVNGQESFGKAVAKVWTDIADTAIESVLKMGETWLEGIAIKKAMALITKQTDASTAASGAYASQASIPFVGPELATAAAAVAYAEVMAFERGGITASGGLAMLHPKEMVLPATIASSVTKMAAGGGSGGGSHHHYHIAINASGSHREIEEMVHAAIVPAIKRAQRKGSLFSP